MINKRSLSCDVGVLTHSRHDTHLIPQRKATCWRSTQPCMCTPNPPVSLRESVAMPTPNFRTLTQQEKK